MKLINNNEDSPLANIFARWERKKMAMLDL